MLKFSTVTAATFLLAATAADAQTAKVTVTPKPTETSDVVKSAKSAGYMVYTWEGCVKRIGFCRYIEIDGKRYSAAVPKDIPFFSLIPVVGQWASGLDSVPEDTPVIATSISLGGPSLLCWPRAVGAITVNWQELKAKKKKACPQS